MNIYAIYNKPGQEDINPMIIRQGFSLIASIFNLFWALYHRMWAVAFIVLLINLLPVFTKSAAFHNHYLSPLDFSVLFIFGFFASEFKEYYAKKKGYKLEDIILADSEEEAEIRYIMRRARTV